MIEVSGLATLDNSDRAVSFLRSIPIHSHRLASKSAVFSSVIKCNYSSFGLRLSNCLLSPIPSKRHCSTGCVQFSRANPQFLHSLPLIPLSLMLHQQIPSNYERVHAANEAGLCTLFLGRATSYHERRRSKLNSMRKACTYQIASTTDARTAKYVIELSMKA